MSIKRLNTIAPGYAWRKAKDAVNIYFSSNYNVSASIIRREIRIKGLRIKIREIKFRFGLIVIEVQLYDDPVIQPTITVFPLNGDKYITANGRTEIPCGDATFVYGILVLEHLAISA